MMRSLSSGVSGLKAHQMAMDVIGNNISNVNTVGFKSGRATFEEVFAETVKGAGTPQDGRGGTNPAQIGLGITVASIDTIMTRGAVNRTDNPTDLCIGGNGFFVVTPDQTGENHYYTRAGNFTPDRDGNLVLPNGMKLLGYKADENGNLKGTLEPLQVPVSSIDKAHPTGDNIQIIDSDGNVLAKKAGVLFENNLDSTSKTASSLGITDATSATSVLETTFKVYDSLGSTHSIKAAFKHMGDATGEQHWTVIFSDANSNSSLNGAGTASADLVFGSDGKLKSAGGDANGFVKLDLTNIIPAAEPLSFNVSFKNLTAAANPGQSNASASTVDGCTQGTLDNFSITPQGEIRGVFSNGRSRTLGRLALANFKNPAGLEKQGENLYKDSNNSGQEMVGKPGNNGYGQINSGALEMSNVDLSKEFTNMITIQRGFQANSKIITTSDEMLQELVNLKR